MRFKEYIDDIKEDINDKPPMLKVAQVLDKGNIDAILGHMLAIKDLLDRPIVAQDAQKMSGLRFRAKEVYNFIQQYKSVVDSLESKYDKEYFK